MVQALNIIALLNPHVTHEMVDGALNQEEVDALKIQAVPSVYANGKLLHVGRGSLGELLQKLEEAFGSAPQEDEAPIERDFDVLVLGGGPAGASAAIYSARKGLRVAIVAERIGGQVKRDGRHRKPYLRAADYWCRTCQRTPHTYRALSDREFSRSVR